MWQGLSRPEGIPGASAHVNDPGVPRRFVCVPLGVQPRRECCIAKGPRNVAVGVLHKQNLSRCWDEISALGKVSIGTGACNEKTAALLSSSYCVRPYRVSPVVIVKKIWLHRLDSQIGNLVGFVWPKVQAVKLDEGTGSYRFHCRIHP